MPDDRAWPADHPGLIIETPDGFMAVPLWGCGPDGPTNPWQNDEPGVIAEAIDGPMAVRAKDGCCEPAPNPCDPDPEMLLTVTGTTGTISWCGQTWTLPADSGVEKSVCPTAYNLFQLITTNVYKTYDAGHLWDFSGTTGLYLKRTYRAVLAGGIFYRTGGVNQQTVRLKNLATSNFLFQGSGTVRPIVPTATASYPDTLLNLISAVGDPRFSDYQITNDFFGSSTVAGVTYTWAKGKGWP